MPTVTNEVLITYGDAQIASVASGTGVYALTANTPASWIVKDTYIAVFECTNSANNGVFKVTAVSGNNITTTNTASVAEASSPGAMGFPVGGASEFLLNGAKNYTKVGSNFDLKTISFDVFLNSESTTEATAEQEFRNRCFSLEAAFSTPRQRLRWIQGAQTMLDLDPEPGSGKNTGYDAKARAEKSADKDYDTGRSRQYSVTIEIKMPASFLPYMSALKDVSFSVEYEPTNQRTVTVTGVYTAKDANDADAQYQANVVAFCASVLSTVDSTASFDFLRQSKKILTHVEPDSAGDITGKEMEFTRVYKEILYNQITGTLDDLDILDQTLRVSRRFVAPGDFLWPIGPGAGGAAGGSPNVPDVLFGIGAPVMAVNAAGQLFNRGATAGGGGATPNRFVEITATYEAAIDATRTKNLRSKWGAIRPWIIKNVVDTLQGGHLAITEIDFVPDYPNNRISATIKGLAAKTGMIEMEVAVRINNDDGNVLVPVWNGDPHARLDYKGPANRRKTETIRGLYVGLEMPKGAGEPEFLQISTLAGVWKRMTEDISYAPKKIGMAGYTIDVTEISSTVVHDYYVPVVLPTVPADIRTPGGGFQPFLSIET